AIAETYPEIFHDFNARMWQPGGFHRPIAPRERKWKTKTGKANFIAVESLDEDPDVPHDGDDRGIFQLITLRSNDQFNTTIYGYNDRFRGVHGTRMVVLMNRNDIARLSLHDGEIVDLVTAIEDGRTRAVRGLRVTAYDIPEGCLGGYYPECNPLIPLWHHAKRSKVPAAKSVPVRIVPSSQASDTLDTTERRVNKRLRFAARDVSAGAVVAASQMGRAMRRDPRWPIGAGLLLGSALALWLAPRWRK